jgi:AraC-like DNA-binding protein
MRAERLECEHPEVQAVECSDDRSLLQRVGILSEFPSLVSEFGVDPNDLARVGGVSLTALSDPNALIPFSRFAALFEEARSLTGCPNIGLLLGTRGSYRMMGLMGQYMANAPTLGVAMTDVVSHQHRYSRGARPYVVTFGEDVVFGYRVHEVGVPAIDQICDAAIAFANAVLNELADARPIEVMFVHAPPADVRPYMSIFRTPVRFNADHNGIVYPSSILSRPVKGADPGRRVELTTRLEHYWAIDPPDIISSLRRVLAVSVLGGDPSLEGSALALNMHPRTLNRRLRERGTTFQRELGLARFSLASQYLESSSVPMTTISNALGYADPSVFTRAFERWSGISPTQWRLARANHDHPAR